ncbi:hypothetical protein SLS55_004436 [Diplodia seriata]|uniref:Tat pathway signal sequence n=1 Tax=Diplodia seriata TaxID=420778 RepID=A0A0G2GCL3_9PEZI|nr:hypothetical protein UCDDS831_g07998 [Diplodia seriata]
MTAFERAAERMKAALKQPYQSLQQEEMAVEQKEEHLGRKQGLNPCKAAIACLAVLSWSIFVFEAGTWYPGAETCAMRTSTWSPAQHLIRYAPQAITGSFYQKSPFRGAGDDVDQAWDDVWMLGGVPLRIEESKLGELGKDANRNWTRIPEAMGGGIAGYPEVFHQLHCLNVLRMASYPDHYSNNTFFVDHPAHVVRGHLDHCIEILRMQLQCSAEMAPILTEDGLPGHEFPTADFNVVHMCRNFDDLKEWTRSHILHGAGNWDIPGHGH